LQELHNHLGCFLLLDTPGYWQTHLVAIEDYQSKKWELRSKQQIQQEIVISPDKQQQSDGKYAKMHKQKNKNW
jgi:hypothetical protein